MQIERGFYDISNFRAYHKLSVWQRPGGIMSISSQAPDIKHTLYLEEITSAATLESLQDEWLELWKRSNWAKPFQSPRWQIAWWRHFGIGELLTLAIHYGGRLAGIVPCFCNQFGKGRLIGTGISDYLDILAENGFEQICAEIFFEYLRNHSDKWNQFEFGELENNSGLLSAPIPESLNRQVSDTHVCPVIKLPSDMDRYYKMLHHVHRRKLFKAIREIKKLGTLKFEKASPQHQSEFTDELFEFHGKTWQSRNKCGVLAESEIQKFHREFIAESISDNVVHLSRLALNEKTIAVVYGFEWSGCFYSYIGGFDPEYARYSPGSVILLNIIEDCINRGLQEFDFLRGAEPYKYLWQAADKTLYHLTIR